MSGLRSVTHILVRFILLLACSGLFLTSVQAASLLTSEQVNQELKQAESNSAAPNQADIVKSLKTALDWLNKREKSISQAKQYQQVINDFPQITEELRNQLNEPVNVDQVPDNLTNQAYEQKILQASSQLLELNRQLLQEQELLRDISDSLSQIPSHQAEVTKILSDLEQRAASLPPPSTPLTQSQFYLMQAEIEARKAQIRELELEQLSASNRQEISRLRTERFKQRLQQTETYQQLLRNSLNAQRQHEAEMALQKTEELTEQYDLPKSVIQLLNDNRQLSMEVNQQSQQMDSISQQQQSVTSSILQARQALTTMKEQAQWLNASTVIGETLRAQVARLPEVPKPQQLDNDMVTLRVKQLHYEELMEKLRNVPRYTQDNGEPLTEIQQQLVDQQLKTQRNLLTSLLSGSDTQILELTKLRVANSQLATVLKEIRDATHRYLFWVADVNPIGLTYPVEVAHDLDKLVSFDTLGQLGNAFIMMVTNLDTLLSIFAAVLLVIVSISSRRHYYAFLERASTRVGKVTQDDFMLTLRTVFWSIIVALPVPVLWAVLGFGLQHAWPYPVAVALGDGVTATLPLLWVFMISASFAHPKGLFIVHFRWSQSRVARVLRYYKLSIWIIVPLIMALITFNNLNDREFAGTLGRLCFLLLCIAVLILTSSLKRAEIPLYLDNNGSGENLINHTMWWLLLCAPALAAISAIVGYLNTSQVILARLETSVALWFILLVVYHIIRRWMLIQRRRIAFDRAKQRRAEMLAQRAKNEEENNSSSAEGNTDIDEPVVDLDVISAQSLRLVRSILTMIALFGLIFLWSELHSAFGFLENINLWDVTTTVQGDEVTQPITLGTLFVSILVLIITTQLVRNLPALLELAVLQHLNLSPGTGYAITTITKYLLMLIGCLVGFSLIGLEWAKLQWLVAALGVGLGFGLQEIFANFISGLIILFEKPIRIGDTVTIRELTGTVTKINTRATTISDWDRKEIIMPNKAFITEQFVNWSLSDSVTRIVLTIPAPAEASSEEVTKVLLVAAKESSLVLDNPAPEAYLVDLQQGIQIFEVRLFAAEMSHRMPLRHELHQLILKGFAQHGIELPYPPLQIRADNVARMRQRGALQPARKSGDL